MKAQVPNALPYNGHHINYAGSGKSPGSHLYLDAASGQTLELFYVQVTRTGPHYCLGAAAGNAALKTVRIDQEKLNGHGPAQIGEIFLAGPLSFPSEGPKARCAWPAQVVNRPQPKPAPRHQGVITRVDGHGNSGRIREERTDRAFFLHHSQLRRGAALREGQRVSFDTARNDKGWLAINAQPA